MSEKDHHELLRPGIFDGLNKVDEQEEAQNVVKYFTYRMSVNPIAPRGNIEAKDWFEIAEIWDKARQDLKLKAMIEASEYDPDYWDAVNLIAIDFIANEKMFLDELAKWVIKRLKGDLDRPPLKQSHEGRPPYANDNRNYIFAAAFGILGTLGLKSKMARYEAIAGVFGSSVRTVSKAIKEGLQMDGILPLPWECWPYKA